MRLYLSSFRLGNAPEAMLELLAGGTRATVIANADDGASRAARRLSVERERADLTSLGLLPEELDLRDYFGRQAELARRLAQSELLWVRGGNAFILRRALRASGADTVILDLLRADSIVYAGYSAGPCMLTRTLRGIDLVDDPTEVPEGYPEEIIWDGLGILPYSLLPHYRSGHPESAAIDASLQFMIDNHLPFVALRDGEALIRNGSEDVVVS